MRRDIIIALVVAAFALFSLQIALYGYARTRSEAVHVNTKSAANDSKVWETPLAEVTPTASLLKNSAPSSTSSVKNILFWNQYFDAPHFEFGVGRQPFVASGCPVDNCRTIERSRGTATADDMDAIIFHMCDLGANTEEIKTLTARRQLNQRYVLFLMEAPGVYYSNLEDFAHFFNWTMTYRIDADIYNPYGLFVQKNMTTQYVDIRKTVDMPWIIYVNVSFSPTTVGKRGLVAWLVSKCRTPSKREHYVKQLAKYVKVAVYGNCGHLRCKGRMSEECYEMLERKYKFYLSFENSLCRDYVTEKLFNVMRYRMVPIVYGGADYKRIAPPGSYIDTRDFASPRALAGYLKMLDANPDKYDEYFRWKETYTVNVAPMSSAMCKLCEMLNDPLQPTKSYANIQEWYSGPGVCHEKSSHWNKRRK